MAVNLDRMSLKDLIDLDSRLQKAIVAARERDRAEVKTRIETMVSEAGFSVSELYGGRGGRKVPSAAKYANPDNRTETWTGRGRKPNWLVEALKKGQKLDSFLAA